MKMVIRTNCLKGVYYPALRYRSGVYAVYFQLQVYIAVQTHVFIENLRSQDQGPASNESLHYGI